MTFEKFNKEIEVLLKFFPIYCENHHTDLYPEKYEVIYQNKTVNFEVTLCEECHMLLNYAIQRLQECPYEEKPRCRKCPNPCYEKDKFKQMAKIMRYSGMKLGLTKAAKKLKRLINFQKSDDL